LKSIRDMFRTDEFIASSEVFPNIDKDRIASTLKLEEEGRKRGMANQPSSDSTGHDHVELKAIGQVEELRRRGLENYETNRRVYAERLNLAVSARMQVETGANDAKSRFVQEVTKQKSLMVTPKERVAETYAWRKRFREHNKLERPAKLGSVWPGVISLSLAMIVLESAGQAYLFSQSNPLGILVGLMAAFLVSVGNVAISVLLGILARYINCRGFRNLHKKFFGLLFGTLWLGFLAVYNLAVAHFRDAAERIEDWRHAGGEAILTLLANPVELNAMESYLLLLLGAFISIVSFIKGHNAGDPYPRYGRISQNVEDARANYMEHLDESIEDLAQHRDDAVEVLQDASQEVHVNINDSIDSLYGQKALTANLEPFLGQCDIAANYVVAVYRDANKATREDTPPAYFDENFSFKPFAPPEIDDDRRAEAEEQLREVSEMVNRAIREIFQVFKQAVQELRSIDELQGTDIETRPRHSTPSQPLEDRNEPDVLADNRDSA